MKVVLKLGLLTFLTCAVAACEEKNEVKCNHILLIFRLMFEYVYRQRNFDESS
jgi:hypothetical protein